ncbi:aspartic protease [Lithospermum erythrorhizon]|uniref:Aspartic proteinase Asp1 n=1 Tax=Lithospermum erythrorhizon TaxID=34254 RepID=A0AAV3PMT9_LITER
MMYDQVFVLFLFCLLFTTSSAESNHKWRSSVTMFNNNDYQETKSSIIFPLFGDVYPNGFFFAEVSIGQPPKPYFLDPDTGSDLTWVQCDAPCVHCTKAPHPYYRPSNDLVPCKDPLCSLLHSDDYKCDDPDQCDYEVEYADGGSSLGVVVKDVLSLYLSTGIQIRTRLTLGCGYDQLPGASYHPLDGVLGLGRGRSSIVSQLHNRAVIQNVIGHCLSARGGGYLFFGDDLYAASQITWTSMSSNDINHYSAVAVEFLFGGKGTGIKNFHVVFDSGSSYTYLNSQTYGILLSLVMKEIEGKPLQEVNDDQTLPFCWKGEEPIRGISDVSKYFKPLTLSFASGWRTESQFQIPPESYLIISSKGSVCMGILNGTAIGLQNLNLIGDISMQDKMVIYDNQKKQIGWVSANCDRLPNSNALFL